MKKKIDKKIYDTEKDTHIGFRYAREFGTPDGFEEQLFVTKDGQYYIYGSGGENSLYTTPAIALITDVEAVDWCKENNIL